MVCVDSFLRRDNGRCFTRDSERPRRGSYSYMSEQHIEKSKATVEAADHIPAEKKAELLQSLAKLKPAIAKVSQIHEEDGQSIARLLEASTQEANRKEKRAGALKKILDELKEVIEKFEASPPKLVELVGEYSTRLANMGL